MIRGEKCGCHAGFRWVYVDAATFPRDALLTDEFSGIYASLFGLDRLFGCECASG
jgi:hypothetical protein